MKILSNPHFITNNINNFDQLTNSNPLKQKLNVNAYLFASLADLAYQSLANIKWKLGIQTEDITNGNFIYFDDCLTTRGFIIETKDNDFIVVFCGSEIETIRSMYEDWAGNIKTSLVPFVPGNKDIKVHEGFLRSLNHVWLRGEINEEEKVSDKKNKVDFDDQLITWLSKCIGTIHANMKINRSKIWFAGHSLGGALATLAAARWAATYGTDNIGGIYTFGSPKCGNTSFINYYNNEIKLHDITFRFVNGRDLIPVIPFTDPTIKKHISLGAGYSAYSIFGYLHNSTGEKVRDAIYYLAGINQDNYYDHVGKPFYLGAEDGSLSNKIPSNFSRLLSLSYNLSYNNFVPPNFFQYSNWLFDHDYKKYVEKIEAVAKDEDESNIDDVDEYNEYLLKILAIKNIFCIPYVLADETEKAIRMIDWIAADEQELDQLAAKEKGCKMLGM